MPLINDVNSAHHACSVTKKNVSAADIAPCGLSSWGSSQGSLTPNSPLCNQSPLSPTIATATQVFRHDPYRSSYCIALERSFASSTVSCKSDEGSCDNTSSNAPPSVVPTAAPKGADFTLVVAPKRKGEQTTPQSRVIRRVTTPKSAAKLKECNHLRRVDVMALWSPMSPARYVVVLRHKCRTTQCISQQCFRVGDHVLCDGDKGVDVGEVSLCAPIESLQLRRGCELPALRAYRTLTSDEMLHYTTNLDPIETGLKALLAQLSTEARSGAQMEDRYHKGYWSAIANMTIVDVEVQADYGKIYVFYRATHQIRFLALAEALFVMYGCRIWLHQLDRHTPSSSANSSLQEA